MTTDHRQRPGDRRLELDHGEFVNIRVYISPLWTVLTSVFEVLLGWRRGVPDEWIRFVKERVDGLDLRPFLAFARDDRTVPNFFLPVPPKPTPSLYEELDALRRTPAKQVRHDLRAEFGRRIPAEYRLYQVDPEAAFAEFTSTVEKYWDAVFKPVWPRMRSILEREVVVSGRVLATQGALPTLSRVHPGFKLKDAAITLEHSRPGHTDTVVGDRRIALIPVVAGSDAHMASLDRKDVVVLAYSVPGASAVWHTAVVSPDESALARVLGATKARVVDSLVEPTSTTLLAKQLGLAAATVSHHLSALLEQGIVESTRVNNVVYYNLTERGRSLVDLFSA